jgi:hypothetical protein
MTTQEIILELARRGYKKGLIKDNEIKMFANDSRTYYRAFQILKKGYKGQRPMKGQER